MARAGFFANGFVFLSGFGAVVYCFFYTLQVRWLQVPLHSGTVSAPARRVQGPSRAPRRAAT